MKTTSYSIMLVRDGIASHVSNKGKSSFCKATANKYIKEWKHGGKVFLVKWA